MKQGRIVSKRRTETSVSRSTGVKLLGLANMLFVWPLGLVTVVALKLESGGPVLVHEGGLRFRTTTSDGKLTRLGRFLRKADLDGFPERLREIA